MSVVAIACRRWTTLPGDAGKAVGVLADYIDAVAAAGPAAVLVPEQSDALAISVLDRCEGLLLAGGEDVILQGASVDSPSGDARVDRRRDELEFLLLGHARSRGMPVLGICRGMHIINIASGGTIEFLTHAVSSPIRHVTNWRDGEVYVHDVLVSKESLLARLAVDAAAIRVNGSHKYCVKTVGHDLCVSARSSDGVIEALEAIGRAFCVGVQWHPESLALRGDPMARALFRAFASACSGTGPLPAGGPYPSSSGRRA